MATTPFTLQPKAIQVETGFAYEKSTIANFRQETFIFNTSLLRYGLTSNCEMRLQADYAQFKTENLNIHGFNPLIAGTKLLISKARGIIPETSLLLNLTLPYVGEKQFRPDHLAPSLYLLMQNDLSEKVNICYNLGVEYDGESPVPSEFVALCLGYSFSDKFSGFVENYNWFSKGAKPDIYVDAGFAYLVSENIQLDLSCSMMPVDIDEYLFVSFGVSIKI